MKKGILLFWAVAALSPLLYAQQPAGKPAEVASAWPGVDYQIFHIERIAGNRLLIGVRLIATSSAPPNGAFITVYTPIPKNADPDMVKRGVYSTNGPLSLDAAVMTDDLTGQTYPVVPPDPAGPNYPPGQILGLLRSNRPLIMTIQFSCPPPPDQKGKPVRQTVSFLLPKATGPIAHLEIPPPAPAH